MTDRRPPPPRRSRTAAPAPLLPPRRRPRRGPGLRGRRAVLPGLPGRWSPPSARTGRPRLAHRAHRLGHRAGARPRPRDRRRRRRPRRRGPGRGQGRAPRPPPWSRKRPRPCWSRGWARTGCWTTCRSRAWSASTSTPRRPATAAAMDKALKAAGVDATVDDHSLWLKDDRCAPGLGPGGRPRPSPP